MSGLGCSVELDLWFAFLRASYIGHKRRYSSKERRYGIYHSIDIEVQVIDSDLLSQIFGTAAGRRRGIRCHSHLQGLSMNFQK